MASTKISTAIIAGALLLIGLGGCSQASAATRELGGVPEADPTSSVSLAPQAQDMPGAPIPSAATSDSTDPVAVPTAGAPEPAATTVAPATAKAVTTKVVTTKVVTTKAAAPKTTAVAPKTTAPVSTYKPPSNVGVLTLSCTWTGSYVTALAQWSGYPGVYITVTAAGFTDTTSQPANGLRVNGDAGVHGACTASGGGQSKSGSA